MKLRHATESDLPRIVEIYNQSIPGRWSTADLEPIPVEARQAWFRNHHPDKRPVWVCEVDGTIAGWLSLEWFYSGRAAYHKTAEVSFYVASGYQGRGIGSYMLRSAIADCPRLGVTALVAMHFDHNEPSAKVTGRLGFQPMGHLPRIAELDGEQRGLVIRVLYLDPNQTSEIPVES